MKQVNIRVSDEEYAILKLIADKKGIPVTSLFKMIISDTFESWKIENLLELYSEGQIRFKEIMRLSGWSYAAVLKKFGELNLEPPLLDVAERRAEEIIKNIPPASILKNPEKSKI